MRQRRTIAEALLHEGHPDLSGLKRMWWSLSDLAMVFISFLPFLFAVPLRPPF